MKDIFPVLNIEQFPSDQNGNFYVNDIRKHIDLHHHHIHKPHKHDFYLTVIFTNGSGFHEVDFNSYEVKPGIVFLLRPGQTHHWNLSDDIKGYMIIHNKEFFDINFTKRSLDDFPFFYLFQNDPSLVIDRKFMEKIVGLFQEIMDEYNLKQDYKYDKIRSLTDLLYIELSRLYKSNISVSDQFSTNQLSKLKVLESLINEAYLTEKSASYYAERMNISPRHLNRIVQNLLGKTTSDLIIERVMLEAQRLLSGSNITIAELSEFLGYDDQSYFSRVFKNRLGITPSEFCKKY